MTVPLVCTARPLIGAWRALLIMSSPTQVIRIGGVDFTVTSLAGDSMAGIDRAEFCVSWSGGILVMQLRYDGSGFTTAAPLEGHGAAFERLPPDTVSQLTAAAAGIRRRAQ